MNETEKRNETDQRCRVGSATPKPQLRSTVVATKKNTCGWLCVCVRARVCGCVAVIKKRNNEIDASRKPNQLNRNALTGTNSSLSIDIEMRK